MEGACRDGVVLSEDAKQAVPVAWGLAQASWDSMMKPGEVGLQALIRSLPAVHLPVCLLTRRPYKTRAPADAARGAKVGTALLWQEADRGMTVHEGME